MPEDHHTVHDAEENSTEAESSSRAVESVKLPQESFQMTENDGETNFYALCVVPLLLNSSWVQRHTTFHYIDWILLPYHL